MLCISGIVNGSAKPLLRNKHGSTQTEGLRGTVLLLGLLSLVTLCSRSSGFQVMLERHQSRKTRLPSAADGEHPAFLQSRLRWLGHSVLGSCLLSLGLLAKPGFVCHGPFGFSMITSPCTVG